MLRLPAISLAATLLTAPLAAQTYQPTWASLDQRPVPAWFEDAKFGIFIHWGIYAVPAWAPTGVESRGLKYSEWYWKQLKEGRPEFVAHHAANYGPEKHYQDFAYEFKAEAFDPDAWADLFQKAGARYVVLTSKHHDGFALWPSAYAWNWNAYDVGPHRDLAGDLMKAVRAKNLKMGYYYSLYEWFHPLYLSDVDAYVANHMLPQMKELVNAYQPDLVWTDGEWDHPSEKWRSTEFLAWLFNDSPVADRVAVNDRWGTETRSHHGGYYTTEYGIVHEGDYLDENVSRPWEECRGIGGSFGYNRAENLNDYQSSQELVHLLVNTVSQGGNLLLNIGPTADGRVPVIMQQRLLDVGTWLDRNGEAIYGTRAWRQANEGERVRYTRKDNDVYATLLGWPGRQVTLEAPQLPAGSKVTLLGHNKPLKWRQQGKKLLIDLPDFSPDMGQYAYVLKLAGAR